ncbi:hypothetical protein C8R43DRAFT_963125 [Mycena crocata]|nr:hypothetical protein C8R43DRAFT_963125 [Mycena crocata]
MGRARKVVVDPKDNASEMRTGKWKLASQTRKPSNRKCQDQRIDPADPSRMANPPCPINPSRNSLPQANVSMPLPDRKKRKTVSITGLWQVPEKESDATTILEWINTEKSFRSKLCSPDEIKRQRDCREAGRCRRRLNGTKGMKRSAERNEVGRRKCTENVVRAGKRSGVVISSASPSSARSSASRLKMKSLTTPLVARSTYRAWWYWPRTALPGWGTRLCRKPRWPPNPVPVTTRLRCRPRLRWRLPLLVSSLCRLLNSD